MHSFDIIKLDRTLDSDLPLKSKCGLKRQFTHRIYPGVGGRLQVGACSDSPGGAPELW